MGRYRKIKNSFYVKEPSWVIQTATTLFIISEKAMREATEKAAKDYLDKTSSIGDIV